MKKVIRIPIFLFPWEIDKFQSTADRLKLCANFLKNINLYFKKKFLKTM